MNVGILTRNNSVKELADYSVLSAAESVKRFKRVPGRINYRHFAPLYEQGITKLTTRDLDLARRRKARSQKVTNLRSKIGDLRIMKNYLDEVDRLYFMYQKTMAVPSRVNNGMGSTWSKSQTDRIAIKRRLDSKKNKVALLLERSYSSSSASSSSDLEDSVEEESSSSSSSSSSSDCEVMEVNSSSEDSFHESSSEEQPEVVERPVPLSSSSSSYSSSSSNDYTDLRESMDETSVDRQ